jgi:DNA-directed RNA polymerase subunit H (RpoH/RPB5)
MEYFDAFDEVFALIDRYVLDNGVPPHEIVVSPALYMWLAELQREENTLHGIDITDPVQLETPHGTVRIVIDETMSPYDVLAQ